MITAAFQRCFNKDYKHNALVGNFQYKSDRLSPTFLYRSPFVGTMLHSKVYNYFEELDERKRMEERRCQQIFVELSENKDDWLNISFQKK